LPSGYIWPFDKAIEYEKRNVIDSENSKFELVVPKYKGYASFGERGPRIKTVDPNKLNLYEDIELEHNFMRLQYNKLEKEK